MPPKPQNPKTPKPRQLEIILNWLINRKYWWLVLYMANDDINNRFYLLTSMI